MIKDSQIIEIFKSLDDKEAFVTLHDGRELVVWNIAWAYDTADDFAHITSNISPSKEGTTIDLFYTSEIKAISHNGNQVNFRPIDIFN